jgi:hypothetical protein
MATSALLIDRYQRFFDSELTGAPSISALLPGEASEASNVEGNAGKSPQLSIASMFLADETLGPKYDFLAIVRVSYDSTGKVVSTYHWMLPDALRTAARDAVAGVSIFDLPVSPWAERDARLAIIVYHIRRNQRSDRLMDYVRNLIESDDALRPSREMTSLMAAAFERIALLRRNADATVLFGGTIAVPENGAGNARYVAVIRGDAELAPDLLAVVDGRLAVINKPEPIIGLSHALLRIGNRSGVSSVRRYIEELRRKHALMREQLTRNTPGESYLSYLEREVKQQRQKTIDALYKRHEMVPLVTPIALEAANDLEDVVKFEDDRETRFKRLIESMRAGIREQFGVNLPGLRVRLNEGDLEAGSYIVMINEIPLVMGTVHADRALCNATPEELSALGLNGEEAIDPGSGVRRALVYRDDWDGVRAAGFTLWESAEHIALHLDSILRKNWLTSLASMKSPPPSKLPPASSTYPA